MSEPTLRSLVPDVEPVDKQEILHRARSRAARRRVLAAVSVAAVAVVAVGGAITLQRQPDAVPAETPSSQPPSNESCPSSRPRTSSASMQPASSPHFYWGGVLYVDAGVRPKPGSARFTVRCAVYDAPRGQEWVTPWPNAAAAGFTEGTTVYRAAGRADDCLLLAQPAGGGEMMAFKPSDPAPGC